MKSEENIPKEGMHTQRIVSQLANVNYRGFASIIASRLHIRNKNIHQ